MHQEKLLPCHFPFAQPLFNSVVLAPAQLRARWHEMLLPIEAQMDGVKYKFDTEPPDWPAFWQEIDEINEQLSAIHPQLRLSTIALFKQALVGHENRN